jgi:hypothetical protein
MEPDPNKEMIPMKKKHILEKVYDPKPVEEKW